MSTLNPGGFILLEIPTENVHPLQILTKGENGTVYLQNFTIKDIFPKSEYALPVMSSDLEIPSGMEMAADLNLSINSNISILQSLLKLIGSSAIASFDQNKINSIKLILNFPKKNTVNEFKLDAYINKATMNEDSVSFKKMLLKDEVYVITEIIKCKDFTLVASDSNTINAEASASLPEIGNLESGLSHKTDRSNSQNYKGNSYLTIGIKAYRILYDKSFWGKGGFRISQEKEIKTIKGEERFSGESLMAETINISE